MNTILFYFITFSILPTAEIRVSILLFEIFVTKILPVNVFTPKKKEP
jgi:hypothetical protein